MQSSSRTIKSVHNAKVALLFYFINLILQFFSRKIFLDYLGSEVLGLNTTAYNLLSFLNIAELGIGAAVAYNLYKPIYEDDRQAINDIVSIQGWLYRRIAYVVIIGACVLMCFFPMIFEKAEVPLWYTYGSFIVLLVSALLGYFVNYRQILLSADQKEYKITYCVQGTKILKVLFQMLAIWLLSHGYVWWMGLEVIFAIITSVVLDHVIKKEYPWLHPTVNKGWTLQVKYPGIITKTKQIFFHKISIFVLTQTSPLIIYAYSSLTLVAIYGNYMLIVYGVTTLMTAFVNSINAGIGSLVAEGNNVKIKAAFWEITILRIWLASIICFGMYMLGHPFIALWMGPEYVMPQSAFIILIINNFICLTRTNEAFLAAYGLFQDVWAPVIEAILNLGCSILFGYYWGLPGILLGGLISLIIIVFSWKPYFLYRDGFKEPITEYILRYLKILGLISMAGYCASIISGRYFPIIISAIDYKEFIVNGSCTLFIYIMFSVGLLYITVPQYRNFIKRMYALVIHKDQ
jgi:O-antigen/teichoic acid export membrane protein